VVDKTRRTAKIGDYEICLDQVNELGDFAEFEKIVDDDANHDEVVAELWKFAEQFDISENDGKNLSGYDVMMKQKDEKL
jgi:predicted adenylyl cyclase CyaB